MATKSDSLRILENELDTTPKNRRESYAQLKAKLEKEWGYIPSALGSGFKRYRKENRVFDEDTKKYINRKTGQAWNEQSLKKQFKSDFRILDKAGRPVSLSRIASADRLLKAENRLRAHDSYQTNLEGRLRRHLSDSTLQGNKVFDVEQAKLREQLQIRVNKAREQAQYRPNAEQLSILNRGEKDPTAKWMPTDGSVGEGYINNNGKLISTGTDGGIIPGVSDEGNAPFLNRARGGDGTNKAGESEQKVAEEKPESVIKNQPKPKDDLKIRSDVFTIDPNTGEALGVMTNAQRRKWDTDNKKHLEEWAKNNELRIYKNKGSTVHSGAG